MESTNVHGQSRFWMNYHENIVGSFVFCTYLLQLVCIYVAIEVGTVERIE